MSIDLFTQPSTWILFDQRSLVWKIIVSLKKSNSKLPKQVYIYTIENFLFQLIHLTKDTSPSRRLLNFRTPEKVFLQKPIFQVSHKLICQFALNTLFSKLCSKKICSSKLDGTCKMCFECKVKNEPVRQTHWKEFTAWTSKLYNIN